MSILNYFAYGSNNLQQLKDRNIYPINIQSGTLCDWTRIFGSFSKKWNGSVSSIYKCNNSKVYGIVYSITYHDIKKLMKYEKGYKLEIINVVLENQTTICAITFIMDNYRLFDNIDNFIKPSKEYILAICKLLYERRCLLNKNLLKDYIIDIKSIDCNKTIIYNECVIIKHNEI